MPAPQIRIEQSRYERLERLAGIQKRSITKQLEAVIDLYLLRPDIQGLLDPDPEPKSKRHAGRHTSRR